MLPIRFISMNSRVCILVALAVLLPAIAAGQDRVVVVRHGSTPEGDIIRARADAVLLLRQAQLVAEKAYAQRLENLIRECDVVYKRFSTRNEMRREALENKYERTFDIIKFNQQLAEIREELEQKAVMRHTRVGDLTDEMNHLLETFTRQSIKASSMPAMRTELTAQQLDAIFLTDGSNVFSGKTGKTRLEAFKWPFMIQRKEFQHEREECERLCDQAIKEINVSKSPMPETVGDLLRQTDSIEQKLDALPLSDSQNIRAVENKWRKEAKDFTHDLTRTLANCSRLDSQKLSGYVFQGKTLGELIDHLNSNGLRFARPSEQDSNLYAAIFFIMRYAYQKSEASNNSDKPVSDDSAARQDDGSPSSSTPKKPSHDSSEVLVSASATYKVSSVNDFHPPLPCLLNGEENLYLGQFAFHTAENTPGQFIQIDLGNSYRITRIWIENRREQVCMQRARNIEIWLSNDAETKGTHVWTAKNAEREWSVAIPGIMARFVRVAQPATLAEPLHLAHVKVFAEANAQGSKSPKKTKANQAKSRRPAPNNTGNGPQFPCNVVIELAVDDVCELRQNGQKLAEGVVNSKTMVESTVKCGDILAVKVRDSGGGARGFAMKMTSTDGRWKYKTEKADGWQAYVPAYVDKWWVAATRTDAVRIADAQWPIQTLSDPSLITIWPDDRHNNTGHMCLKITPELFQASGNNQPVVNGKTDDGFRQP